MSQPSEPFRRNVVHYAWIVVAIAFIAIITGTGIRSASSVLINPLEAQFGWNRAAISTALGINLLLFGVFSPVWGYLTDRRGPRTTIMISLAILAVGAAGTIFSKNLWHFILFWGVIVGAGSGGVASVLPASVANRWFSSRVGLALGILNSASSMGQLIFIPLLMAVILAVGWQAGLAMMIGVTLVILTVTAIWMRNDPADIGIAPYGAAAVVASPASLGSTAGAAPARPRGIPIGTLFRNGTFWFLAASFFVCGATSIGLVGTHMIPHAIEHGIPEMTAATTVGIMGGVSMLGTLFSGWMTDRTDPRKIISVVFTIRGLSLFMLPFVSTPTWLYIFGIIFGLGWFAIVPPVMVMAGRTFGKTSVATVFGLIFLAHQVGSSISSTVAGTLRVWLGDYQMAFLAGGIMTILGAGLALVSLRTWKTAAGPVNVTQRAE